MSRHMRAVPKFGQDMKSCKVRLRVVVSHLPCTCINKLLFAAGFKRMHAIALLSSSFPSARNDFIFAMLAESARLCTSPAASSSEPSNVDKRRPTTSTCSSTDAIARKIESGQEAPDDLDLLEH